MKDRYKRSLLKELANRWKEIRMVWTVKKILRAKETNGYKGAIENGRN